MHIDEAFRKLARTQIGFATGGLLCAAVSQTLAPQGLSVFTYTLSGAFFALVLYAGKELARGTRRGVLLSLIAQGAQVVHLNFVGLGVLFLAGPFIEFGASSSVLLVTGGAGAVGYLGSNAAAALLPGARLAVHAGIRLDTVTPHPSIAVGVNIVALVFAIRLWRLWRLFTAVLPSATVPAA